MGFSSVRFYNFRNIRDGVLDVDSPEVFLVGENGQGKTNVMEAVYLLSFGSSFRTKRDEYFFRHGVREMALEGSYVSRAGDGAEVLLKIRGKQKEILLDGESVRDRGKMIGRFPCIVFCHDDIAYITGTPDRQRTFFNQTLSLNEPLFLDVFRRYTKALKQRNSAIKGGNWSIACLFDEELVRAGCELTRLRREIAGGFSDFFCRLFREISGLDVRPSIRYVPSWQAETEGEILAFLEKKREADVFFSTTTTGPHRDKFRFFFGERDFMSAASTGQIRLASLILKTAQAAFFFERCGRRPVLLLDDVLLEMDPVRRRLFIERLPPYEQAFFTFLPDEQFEAYRKPSTRVYRVQGGEFFE
jgi:DNA replication and repair protein RecF